MGEVIKWIANTWQNFKIEELGVTWLVYSKSSKDCRRVLGKQLKE